VVATVVQVPTPKAPEPNPELKDNIRLVWASPAKSPDEIRSENSKYAFDVPRSSWIQAGSNDASGDSDGKGRKRARAEDFI